MIKLVSFEKIKAKFFRLKFVRLILYFSRKIVLPGFEGLPLYEVAAFFFKGIQKGALNTRSTSLSFTFFLALFPTIIFFFTLIPYIPIHNFQETLLNALQGFFPIGVYEAIKTTLEDIVKRQRGDLLSIGFILALYFSTNGINGIIAAFNRTYHTIETRTVFMRRLISIVLVFIIAFMVILAISFMIFSKYAIDYLVEAKILTSSISFYILIIGKWLILMFLCYFSISFIYYLAPAKRLRFKFFSAGSTLATVLSVITTIGFNFWVTNFGQYNKLYGSIGTLIIVLLLINFNSFILLIGFELNASINSAKNSFRRGGSKTTCLE